MRCRLRHIRGVLGLDGAVVDCVGLRPPDDGNLAEP